jgi:hypothetical protein
MLAFVILGLFVIVSSAFAAVVPETTADQVAANYLKAHVAQYGSWNGVNNPVIGNTQIVTYQGVPIAYQINISPTGSILAAYYDDFSPVLFYSPSGVLDPSRVDDPNAVESWLIPEIYNNVNMILNGRSPQGADMHAMKAIPPSAKTTSPEGVKIANAWTKMGAASFEPESKTSVHELASVTASTSTVTSVGPLLQTEWNQGDPYGNTDGDGFTYNLYIPAEPAENGSPACTHAYTGCVATAMAQVMKYWNWPDSGVGSNAYQWNGTSLTGPTISASFAHSYDWANMPSVLTQASTSTQDSSVAQLMSDLGVAVNMMYTCSGSGASPNFAATAFSQYFKYVPTQFIARASYAATDNTDFMNAIMAELNAPTPRPILLSIYTTNGTGGHEVVIDGYQNIGGTDQVHVNMGWGGLDDGYYDITNNWTAGYAWAANNEAIITGIQPTTYPLTVNTNGNGTVTPSTGSLTWNGTTGTATYYGGTQVTLTAVPATGYAFSGWSGGSCSGVGTCVATINSTSNSATAAFTPSNATTYSISGTVAMAGVGLPGVSMSASGTKSGAVITDSNGNFSFAGMPSGTYTLTPVKSGYVFSPASMAVSVSKSNMSGESFTWSQTSYTITATVSGEGSGSITPSGVTAVNLYGSQTYTIKGSSGNIVSNVMVDGNSIGPVNTYTFSNVTTNHTINAVFVSTYTITATAGTGGTISPAGTTTVGYWSNQAYVITPASGYYIANVLVDGVSQGSISTYTFSTVYANHTISATFAPAHTITAIAGPGGSISPAGVIVAGANSVPFNIAAATGSYISGVTVNGAPVTLTLTGMNIFFSYTFPAGLTANQTISATFKPIPYTISASVVGVGGTISPAGNTSVNPGGSQTYTFAPSSGYSISAVSVDGKSVGAVSTYTFSNVTANHTISAAFSANTYTITATAGTGGAISPAGTTKLVSYNSQTYVIVPMTGYSIAGVTVDGVSKGAISIYAFTFVTANHTISATFSPNTYTVATSAGTGGVISPVASQTVNYGSKPSFIVTPNTGYAISSVTGCGGTLSGNTYTTGAITASCSVSATFNPTTYTVTPSASSGGSISPSVPQTVSSGAKKAFTVTPNSGYTIASVKGCGGTLSGNTYTTAAVTANCSVVASFTQSTLAAAITSSIAVQNGTGLIFLDMTATATDSLPVTALTIYLDGGRMSGPSPQATQSAGILTSYLNPGPHTIMATANDATGNTVSKSITVTLSTP